MKRTFLGITCAAALALIPAAAGGQQSSPGTQQQPRNPQTQGQGGSQGQGQTQQGQQGQAGQQKGRTVTLTGCVYQASDQPAMYALRDMGTAGGSERMGSATGQPGTGQTTQGQTGQGQTTQGQTAQGQARTSGTQSGTGTAGTQAGTTGTAATSGGAQAGGGWYRLAPGAQQDLKEFRGKRVEISGTVTPGRDEKGADIVIHRIEPDRTTVTAIDLKPAPQLSINTIRAAGGTCVPAASGAQQKGQN